MHVTKIKSEKIKISKGVVPSRANEVYIKRNLSSRPTGSKKEFSHNIYVYEMVRTMGGCNSVVRFSKCTPKLRLL